MVVTAQSPQLYVAKKRPFLTRRDWLGYLFISQWIFGFLAFTLLPFLASLFLSFTDWQIVGKWHWIGLANYQKMFSGVDDRFTVALGNTFYYAAFTVPGGQIIALTLAMLLNKKTRGISLYRTLFYIPAIASGVGTAASG